MGVRKEQDLFLPGRSGVQWVMERGLAGSGGSVGKVVQGACAPMAGLALREQQGCFR